jgi:hypothetical protein
MKTTIGTYTLLLAFSWAGPTLAQGNLTASPQRPTSAPGHEPPAQAYTDCQGKKAGDAVEHTTREGKVAATCELSPKGLVARPKHAKPDDGTAPGK